MRLRDGGGLVSDGDWGKPKGLDSFAALRKQWFKRILEWGLVQRLQAHVHCKCKEPMLSASETATLRNDLQAFLLTQGLSADNNITAGQPLALGLMEACQQVCGDVDTKLTQQLAEGVPTGVVNTIPASSVWQQVDVAERPELSLLVWDEPWQSGSDDPKTLLGLVQADVDDGFAEWLSGGLAEARERFGELCAAGKLGLVHREGAAPRLIGDSSVSNANALCRIEERVELPGLRDVAAFLSRYPEQSWSAFSLDISKAHKRVKVHPSERGLSLFSLRDPCGKQRWVVYHTCTFGCSWAAYWWSRVGAVFVRLGHQVLFHMHFLCMYVDDSLALLPRKLAGPMACLLVCLACCLGFPLSWHKLSLGDAIEWIGWQICLAGEPHALLPANKLSNLLCALDQLCGSARSVPRKVLQTLVGRLVWYTNGAFWLKPWMATWFHMLRKPRLRFAQLDNEQLEEVCAVLDAHCIVKSPGQCSDVQVGWRLLTVNGRAVCRPQDALSFPVKRNKAWVKFGEPDAVDISITKEERATARFFRQLLLLQEEVPIPLIDRAGPNGVAAADAYASGQSAGLGGWWLPDGLPLHPANIQWFSISLRQEDLPKWFTEEAQDLQSLISALEALAQLVLLECRLSSPDGVGRVGWCSLRQGCDNFGVVCATSKGLSLKQPLASVLQAAALLCLQHQVTLRVSHVAGVRNEWADALSRGFAADADFWSQLQAENRYDPKWRDLLCSGRL